MAKSAIIGAMHVTLGANTAQFEKAMTKAQSRLGRFSGGMAKAAAGVAAALAGVGTAVGVAMRGMLQEADKLTKMGRAIGVPVEQLSALKHAAELSGVSIEKLGSSMSRFARNIGDAASDAQSTAGRAFAAIGVSVQNADGTLRSSMEVMRDIADRFKGMEDGAGKTAIAMQLFGRTGADMINMLNAGSAGINAMMMEAAELGIVIDQQTGEAAERFNDALDKMGKVQKGIITQITARLAPTFAMLAERMVEATKNSNAMKYAGDLLAGTLKGLLTAGTIVAAIFRELGRVVAAVAGAIVAIAQGEFSQAAQLVKQHWSNAKESVAADMQFINDLWAETAAKTAETAVQFQDLTAAPVVQSTRAMADEMRGFHMAAMGAMNEIINSPTETFQAKMAAVEEAVRSGAITFQQFGRLTKRIHEDQVQQWHDLGSAVASSLTTIFGKSKVAAVAAAVINTAQAVTRTLAAYPWPLSGAMAALAAASGAAQIATIKSTNLGGGGKTPSVRGGAGESAGGGSAQPAQQLPSQTLHVQGINPNDIFTGETMRALMDQLLQRQRDGAQVVLA